MRKETARAIEKYHIGIVFNVNTLEWHAGDYSDSNGSSLTIESMYNRSMHVGQTIDSAVEDFCNARNLPYENER
jgi:hypothetical protein